MPTQGSMSPETRRASMRALGRRGGNETVRRYRAVYMREIGHAGYVAAGAAGLCNDVMMYGRAWTRGIGATMEPDGTSCAPSGGNRQSGLRDEIDAAHERASARRAHDDGAR